MTYEQNSDGQCVRCERFAYINADGFCEKCLQELENEAEEGII